MTEIHILPSSVYNKIAAGEVVEKPASVVKELVENALDAKADTITIRITAGGLSRIEVSDNGEGIAKEQLGKVFLPHATSKIATDSDLFGIITLGFRGEAMASIAAVANVTVVSRTIDADAYSISADGGKIGEITPIGASYGTTVTVRNLFYHTPARLKFLRSEKSEAHDITLCVQRLVLANPKVRFQYCVDGKCLLQTDGTGLETAVRAVLGEETFGHLLPVEAQEYGYRVYGFVSDTLYSAGTKAQQFTIINGRVVSNVNLHASIANVYRDHLMKRQYPIYVLHIEMPPEEVDVNVHPTKADVRFSYANKLFGFVYRTVKAVLESAIQARTLVFDHIESAPANDTNDLRHIELQRKFETMQTSFFEDNDLLSGYRNASKPQPISVDATTEETKDRFDRHDIDLALPKEHPISECAAAIEQDILLIGQAFGTYLLAQYGDDLLLIDQHAAAERVLYDRLVQQYTQGNIVVQPLMLPYEFTLNPVDSAILSDRIPLLKQIGVEIEEKENTFAITAVAALLTSMDMDLLLRSILDVDPVDSADLFKEKLAYAACRAAIKGNTYLDSKAAELLVKDLFSAGLPSQCPHGRPAYVRITRTELEKMFRRKV